MHEKIMELINEISNYKEYRDNVIAINFNFNSISANETLADAQLSRIDKIAFFQNRQLDLLDVYLGYCKVGIIIDDVTYFSMMKQQDLQEIEKENPELYQHIEKQFTEKFSGNLFL